MTSYPKENESQEIGRLAGRALNINMPNNWIDKPLDGDTDFGIDYLVQLKREDSTVSGIFFLQLKGTRDPEHFQINEGSQFSYSFNTSTINFYKSQETPVMVALVCLNDEDPSQSPIYYKWLDEDYLEELSDKLSSQKNITIHIPKANHLTRQLNVIDYYNERLNKRGKLNALYSTIQQNSTDDDPLTHLDNLKQTIKKQPSILHIKGNHLGAPWLENPTGHAVSNLEKINTLLDQGRVAVAQSLLDKVEKSIGQLTQHELAEYYLQLSNLNYMQGLAQKGDQYAKMSAEHQQHPRYKMNYYGANTRDESDIKQLISKLDDKNLHEACYKSQLLALTGDMDKALEVLEPYDEAIVTKLSIISTHNDIHRLDQFWSLQSDTTELQHLCYKTFRFKIFFLKGTNIQGNNVAQVSLRNCLDYNRENLDNAGKEAKAILNLAQTIGFPLFIYDYIQMISISLQITGSSDVFVSYITPILEDRNYCETFATPLIRILLNQRNFNKALKTLDKITQKNDEQIFQQIFSMLCSNQKKQGIELLHQQTDIILSTKPEGHERLFFLAAQSANQIANEKDESIFLNILKSLENSKTTIPLYNLLIDLEKSNLNIEQKGHLNLKFYTSFYKPTPSLWSATILINQLNPNVNEEADAIIDITGFMMEHIGLTDQEFNIYLHALYVTEAWNDLVCECKNNIFHQSPLIVATYHAHALQQLGRGVDALDVLESEIKRDSAKEEDVKRLVSLAIDLGFSQRAIEILEQRLEISDTSIQIEIIDTLVRLYNHTGTNTVRLIELINKYGAIVDPNSEEEEGRYLSSVLLMTLQLAENEKQHLNFDRDRLASFTQRFPNNSFLRRGNIEENSQPEEIINQINELAGISAESQERISNIREQLRSKDLLFPFALLHKILPEARNVAHTWHLANQETKPREYQLRYSDPVNITFPNNPTILLDDITLMVLEETGILEKILSSSLNIAITQKNISEVLNDPNTILTDEISPVMSGIKALTQKRIGELLILPSDEDYLVRYKFLLEKNLDFIFCSDDYALSKISEHQERTTNSIKLSDHLVSEKIITENEQAQFFLALLNLNISNIALDRVHLERVIDFLIADSSNFIEDFQAFLSFLDSLQSHINNWVSLFIILTSILLKKSINEEKTLKLIKSMIKKENSTKKEILFAVFFVGLIIDLENSSSEKTLKKQAWRMTSELICTHKLSVDTVIKECCIALLYLKPNEAQNSYQIILRTFEQGSNEEYCFRKTYTKLAFSMLCKTQETFTIHN